MLKRPCQVTGTYLKRRSPDQPPDETGGEVGRLSKDTLLLFVLLIARARIDTLVEWAAIPTTMLQADAARLLGSAWPASGLALLADRQTTDPVTLILISLAFGLFLAYLMVDILAERWTAAAVLHIKLGLVVAVVVVLVFGQTALLIGLRHITNPAAYTHDGGVIQTEVTVQYLLSGVNPYVADYLNTPMAAWGTEYRTALYHYPYLPWTFLFSAPFYLLSQSVLGWFDERFVYLLLFAATLALACSLARRPGAKLAVVMLLGLNPILASDVIFGQNDAFVLFWIVLAVWLLRTANSRANGGTPRGLAMAAFGLACASKPTAWFLAPFWLLAALPAEGTAKPSIVTASPWDVRLEEGGRLATRVLGWLGKVGGYAWPLVVVFVLVVGPWFVWNPRAMVDDVWRWSAGTSATPYQIRGWGLSNFVLAFSLVPDRLAYWPFWIAELLVAAPLLVLLLWRQTRHNTPAIMLHGYGVLLFGFFYFSRFLNENYLGYLLAVFALAYCVEEAE
jgi:hypothetical protein